MSRSVFPLPRGVKKRVPVAVGPQPDINGKDAPPNHPPAPTPSPTPTETSLPSEDIQQPEKRKRGRPTTEPVEYEEGSPRKTRRIAAQTVNTITVGADGLAIVRGRDMGETNGEAAGGSDVHLTQSPVQLDSVTEETFARYLWRLLKALKKMEQKGQDLVRHIVHAYSMDPFNISPQGSPLQRQGPCPPCLLKGAPKPPAC